MEGHLSSYKESNRNGYDAERKQPKWIRYREKETYSFSNSLRNMKHWLQLVMVQVTQKFNLHFVRRRTSISMERKHSISNEEQLGTFSSGSKISKKLDCSNRSNGDKSTFISLTQEIQPRMSKDNCAQAFRTKLKTVLCANCQVMTH